MALKFFAPALLAAAAAAAIGFAPVAAADDDNERGVKPGGNQRGTSQQEKGWNKAPKGWTNEAQWARPGASNIFGSLPKPPAFALD